MKKIKTLSTVLMLAICAISFAQEKPTDNATHVTKFDAGKTLSKADIGFLDLVANGPTNASRGHIEKKEVTIDKTTLKEGQKITKDDAAAIDKKVKEFNTKHKDKVEAQPTKPKSRGADYCYYYYYCDGSGYCYYYYTCD